ncbi:lytic transglycosylase domain-containing protein [Hymenobacter nivis]|uniref:LysM peptidoglycan-binding domain-containing protein n=1 Tax=Hymenobacter nivis TaxID=1850093 RepID=A0A502GT03_9BACT|nr:lytic transglycosylase domain-containing protein [Hymenobacter nivis]TPG64548.1 LysM peptidoglycan-binding domain-containing protein [Hymenobacter nivis]
MKQGRTPAFRPGRLWRRLALALPLVAPVAARAQQLPPLSTDTTKVPVLLLPDSLAVVPVVPVDSVRLAWLQTPPTVRDLVGDRMSCIETDAPHQFNNAVMAYITLFTVRKRDYTQRVLERENLYFPLFEKYLAQYHLPLELKYLAVVESSLIPTAKSQVGATGLWQFMGPTAGDLRLRRDEWVDERMAPEKATEGACKHLRYLYGVFHDWELVLAAYNWGAGNVQRVMRRTGKKTFWDLYPHLPAETRNYVPTFTAVMYSMKYAQEHGLHSDKLAYQRAEALDTLGLRGQAFDLHRLSTACGYSDSTYLTRYNPELFRAGLPAGYRPYVVRYPATARAAFGGADRATLLAYCQPLAALPQPLAALPPRLDGVEPWGPKVPLLAATEADDRATAPRVRRVRHVVRRGETVAGLAERFDVSPTQFRRWNELTKKQLLKPGRTVVVLVPQPAARPAVVVAAVAPSSRPAPVRPLPLAAEVTARQALAAANALEVARVAAVAAQEEQQALRLAKVRQRQEAAQHAQARIAAIQAAALAKTTAALAGRRSTEPVVVATVPIETATETLVAINEATLGGPAEAAEAPAHKPRRAPAEAAARPRDNAAEVEPTPTATTSYVVRRGDNLTKLAEARGVSVAQLVAWNHLDGETVETGQRLRFGPPAGAPAKAAPARLAAVPKTHRVQPGDTLYNISRRFNVSVAVLRRLNHLTSDDVKLGQKLLVPQG